MSGILRLESLTKGNTLKQGDKTPLKYRLFDADGEKLNIAGKTAVARLMYPDFLRVGYESEELTVSPDNTVTFSIDKVIQPILYYLEITVDDKYIFPSRNDESKLNIDKSSKGSDVAIIEIVGKDVLVRDIKNMVDSEIEPVVNDMIISNQKVIENEKIVKDVQTLSEELEARQDQVEQFNNQVITEMTDKDVISAPEIISGRVGVDGVARDTLKQRLDDEYDEITTKMDQNALDVQSFGAVPSINHDQSDAIQTAINSAKKGQRVLLTGKFYISKPIIMPHETIALEGLSSRESGLIKRSDFSGEAAVILKGSSSQDSGRIKYSQFKNFAIEGANKTGHGFALAHLNFPIFENVMIINNAGTGIYFDDVQDVHASNLISIYNTVNMVIYGRCTGFDFYKILLKYGREKNLLITTDGLLDGVQGVSNRSDRITFWGGLIEGDSFNSQPESEQYLVEILGASKVSFNDVGFSKGKYPNITGIKVDSVDIEGMSFVPRDILFNNNIMHSSTPPDSGVGINIVNGRNVTISKFSAEGIEIPIKIGLKAFETVVTRDCAIDFSKIINESSTTFETSRSDTGYWSYMSRLHLQTPQLQLGPTETTSTRELMVDQLTRQTKLRRTAGSEGGVIDFFKIYGSGIFEPYIFRLNDVNPATTIAGTFRISNGFLEIRNSTNTGWDAYQKVSAGSTDNRPSVRPEGFCYFDTTIKKAIWWVQGSGWLDSSGNVV